MQKNCDLKRKQPEKTATASPIFRKTVTAILCCAAILAANSLGDDKVKAYTAAFKRALVNDSFKSESLESLKDAAEKIHKFILPNNTGAGSDKTYSDDKPNNNGMGDENTANGIYFQ